MPGLGIPVWPFMLVLMRHLLRLHQRLFPGRKDGKMPFLRNPAIPPGVKSTPHHSASVTTKPPLYFSLEMYYFLLPEEKKEDASFRPNDFHLNQQISDIDNMPIYEFKCNACKKEFETIVSSFSNIQSVTCEQCGSQDITRVLSPVNSKVNKSGSLPLASTAGCRKGSGFS